MVLCLLKQMQKVTEYSCAESDFYHRPTDQKKTLNVISHFTGEQHITGPPIN